jgi:mRNA interferase MazF
VGSFVKGDVVVVPFPFSDLSRSKRRPALVVAELEGDDLILCQITSRTQANRYAIPLADADFDSGRLQRDSYIRAERLFTADSALIAYGAGTLKPDKMSAVTGAIVAILES